MFSIDIKHSPFRNIGNVSDERQAELTFNSKQNYYHLKDDIYIWMLMLMLMPMSMMTSQCLGFKMAVLTIFTQTLKISFCLENKQIQRNKQTISHMVIVPKTYDNTHIIYTDTMYITV